VHTPSATAGERLCGDPPACRRRHHKTKLGNHSFRVTGITAYLKNGGTLEKGHGDGKSCLKADDRRRDEVSLDEVERIVI
jgi:hypothetical protein